ncbi:MAG: hypothetical protein KME14_26070 [Tildeniella torsiva UHER 1998/13D]|jgi:hypothetical protein|nr:hypothetical protein [Tildeniella torsiva UHER 1998/13D]
MSHDPWPTSKILDCAATIAARAERKGQPMTPTDAVDRAIAAEVQLRQLAALRDLDWADTVPLPPLPAGVSIGSLLALPLALLLAAPSWGQAPEQRLGRYTYADTNGQTWTVREGQNKSPAGFPDIAFRPSCEQVIPVGQVDGNTAWTLTMPDGNTKLLATYPNMDGFEARRYLSDDGLCVWGGDVVPVVYTSMLPQQQQVQPEIATAGTGDIQKMGANVVLLGLGGLLLTGAAGIGFMLVRKGSKTGAQAGSSPSPLSKFEEVLFQSMEDDKK